MLAGGTALLCGAGLFLASSTLHANPRRRPVEINGEIGVVVFFGSAYRDSLRAFGQDGPEAGVQLAGRVLWGLGAPVFMGLRAGYLGAPASAGSTLVDHPLGARAEGNVWFHLIDVGWALRWIPWQSRTPGSTSRFAVDLELGAAATVTSAPRGSDMRLTPRLALSLTPGLASVGPALLGIRFGVQYIPSGGASGGDFWDPAFAGVTFDFELGGRP